MSLISDDLLAWGIWWRIFDRRLLHLPGQPSTNQLIPPFGLVGTGGEYSCVDASPEFFRPIRLLGALLDAGEFMTIRRFESRVASIGIQVILVGLVMVGIGGLLFLVGGFLLPAEPVQVGNSESLTVSSETVESFFLPNLEDLEGTTAVVVVYGDIRGRFVLDRLNASSLSEDGSFTLSFRNGELDNLVIAGSGAPGIPISGEALDVSAALGGINFFGFRGQCSGELDSIEMQETIFVKDFWYVGPTGAGMVTCTGLTALSSGQTVSFEAVFRFDQRECAGGCE